MLQLLSPFALLGLAALAIPAILHLWRPPPATIRVGTLRFFTSPAVRRLTKLRWRERLLLALRLLLLAMLALLLAQPIWRKGPPTTPQRWALVEPGLVLNGDSHQRWRELDAAGFELRELSRGFRSTSLRAVSQLLPGDTDIWSLVRELDARLPAGSQVAVFASNRIATLRGERPALQHCTAEWISVSPPAAAQSVTVRSVRTVAGGEGAARRLDAVVAVSDAAGSHNVTVTTEAAPGKTALPAPLEGWFVEVASSGSEGFAARALRDDGDRADGVWVQVSSPPPIKVALLHAPDRAEDARYVEAALRAIGETSGRTISISRDGSDADWTFWLNDEPPPSELVSAITDRRSVLLSDAENSADASATTVSSIQAPARCEQVALFRRVAAAGAAETLWTDGFGVPLLSVAREGSARHFRFFSRLHPEWNDLPRSSALATALGELLIDDSKPASIAQHDQRRVASSQAAPAKAEDAASRADIRLQTAAETVDLHKSLWLLCLLVFALERALSHRRSVRSLPEPPHATRQREPALAEHA